MTTAKHVFESFPNFPLRGSADLSIQRLSPFQVTGMASSRLQSHPYKPQSECSECEWPSDGPVHPKLS